MAFWHICSDHGQYDCKLCKDRDMTNDRKYFLIVDNYGDEELMCLNVPNFEDAVSETNRWLKEQIGISKELPDWTYEDFKEYEEDPDMRSVEIIEVAKSKVIEVRNYLQQFKEEADKRHEEKKRLERLAIYKELKKEFENDSTQ